MKALPTPMSAIGSRSSHVCVAGCMTRASHSREAEVSPIPTAVMPRGCTRSDIRPATGARPPEMTAIGASSRAEEVGESPRTAWA